MHLRGVANSERKKFGYFDLKSWVTGGTKIWHGIPSNWRMFESNWLDIESHWLDIESQIDSILRVKLTRYWESNWLDIESQTDSKIFSNYSESRVESYFDQWLNFVGQNDYIFLSVKFDRYLGDWLDKYAVYSRNCPPSLPWPLDSSGYLLSCPL